MISESENIKSLFSICRVFETLVTVGCVPGSMYSVTNGVVTSLV